MKEKKQSAGRSMVRELFRNAMRNCSLWENEHHGKLCGEIDQMHSISNMSYIKPICCQFLVNV